MIRVPFIPQKPELPAGCEVVSLAMALAHRGYPADKCRLAAEDLPKGRFHRTDPDRAYLGDPATRLGWYCFPPVIVETGNRFLARRRAPFRTVDLTGLSDAAFRQLLWAGTPVLAWITDDLLPPRRSTKWCWPLNGESYRPFSNLHCVVVQGWEDGMVWVLDPLTRPHFLPEAVFCPLFSAMGRRAAAVLPVQPGPCPAEQGAGAAQQAGSRQAAPQQAGMPQATRQADNRQTAPQQADS